MSQLSEVAGEFNLSEYGKLKVIGCTDEVAICFCCGKDGLKRTAVMQDSFGNFSFFGTTCASKASSKWDKSINRDLDFQLPVELKIGRFVYRYRFDNLSFETLDYRTGRWVSRCAQTTKIMIELSNEKDNIRRYPQKELNLFLEKLEDYGHYFPF